jgi:hypothetical protein
MMAEPISVGVGGYYHTGLVITADDDDSDRGHALQQNIELEVAGSTTLDNGITVSVRARLEGDSPGSSNLGESEVNLSGGFGRIAYGTVEGAAQNGTIWSPGNSLGGVKSPWFGSGISGWTTGAMDEDALKISYYSPAFNGISFGLSYAPENSTLSYAGRTNNDGGYGEGIQSAINYSVDVMGGSFSANVGYETYTSEDNSGDAAVTRFGATLSIDQISVGGAVQTRTAHDENGDQILSDVGVSWSQGPLSLGYSYGAVDNDSAGNTVINGVGAKYNLGPGIDFAAQFNMVEAPNMAGDGTEESTEILLGTFINF